MKKIGSVAVCLLLLLTSATAQLRKIPAEVTEAFKVKFPRAEKVEWKDKLTAFEASFNADGVAVTAGFSTRGEWQYTERGLTYSDVPEAVQDGFDKSKYADEEAWKMGEVVTKIIKSDNGVLYRIYVDKIGGIQKKYLFFNATGQLEREAFTL